MNNITYRKIDYKSKDDKEQIIRLYKNIFKLDYSEGYDFWFRDNEKMEPLGIAAVSENTGEFVGHFTSLLFEAKFDCKPVKFRMSMGFMTDENFRGMGIGGNLYRNLMSEIIEKNDAEFVMGFPNDVSYRLHIERMEYESVNDYSFVQLPKTSCSKEYKKCIDIEGCENVPEVPGHNLLNHKTDYMNWRFGADSYYKYVSEDGKTYICTKFRDKADILYWSYDVSEAELLDFAAFIYDELDVNRVTTWNSVNYLKDYPAEDRAYHMCINFLNCDEERKKQIKDSKWLFYMGDCELF